MPANQEEAIRVLQDFVCEVIPGPRTPAVGPASEPDDCGMTVLPEHSEATDEPSSEQADELRLLPAERRIRVLQIVHDYRSLNPHERGLVKNLTDSAGSTRL